jgi:hypothetical protein
MLNHSLNTLNLTSQQGGQFAATLGGQFGRFLQAKTFKFYETDLRQYELFLIKGTF